MTDLEDRIEVPEAAGPQHADARPILHRIAVADLRPTQFAIGFDEVAEKVRHWQALDTRHGRAFLGDHMLPVVIGPKEHAYLIDNHHLARALQLAGVGTVLVRPIARLSRLKKSAFWRCLDGRNWVRAYDNKGRRRAFEDMPRRLSDLQDDPYRSLAGSVRRAGGYAKDLTPFSEFLWADHFRDRIPLKELEADRAAALARAMALARDHHAAYLPGWCGVEGAEDLPQGS